MARISELHYSNNSANVSDISEFVEVALTAAEHQAVQNGTLDLVVSYYNQDGSLAGEFNLNTLPSGGIVFDNFTNEFVYVLDRFDAVGTSAPDGNNDGFQTGIALTDPDGNGLNNAEAYALTDLTNGVVISFVDIGSGTTGITPAAGVGAVGTVGGGTISSTNIPVQNPPNQITTSIQFNQPDPNTPVFEPISRGDSGVCFVKGSEILTPDGYVPIESLNAGDPVLTRDCGVQPILWIGSSYVSGLFEMAPIRIEAGKFGAEKDILISPNHRIALATSLAEILLDTNEFLVPAKRLLDVQGVSRERRKTVEYYHILFGQHQLVNSSGLWSESLNPGHQALSMMEAEARAEILKLMPQLETDASFILARPEAAARETLLLLNSASQLPN
ncbi:MAG: Hint domain-containing protein [Pseudomonadota bacterium]